VRRGPGRDLEAVYREHGERLWRAVLAYAGDREVASDAVAEAFAQALRRGSAIRNPEAWVWRASFRIAAGELKARRRLGSGIPAGSYQSPELDTDLLLALKRLSAGQRAAVLLHHYAGYSTREIAAILGSTAPAVRVHLYRGRRRLRALLDADD
jgi:RNA polymerase sigma factor (sigma-70 family)